MDGAYPPLVPRAGIRAPEETTHFRIVPAAAAVDFETGTFNLSQKSTDGLPWDDNEIAGIRLQHKMEAPGTLPVFIVLGIRFWQFIGGKEFPAKMKTAMPSD